MASRVDNNIEEVAWASHRAGGSTDSSQKRQLGTFALDPLDSPTATAFSLSLHTGRRV
jgi:hypothetical protein